MITIKVNNTSYGTINSTSRGCIFAASTTKLDLSFVYNPNVMLAISLGSVSLAPFSPDRRKHGLRNWWRPHPQSWITILPSLRSLKPHSGRHTDDERHSQSSTPYNKAPVQLPSMLLSFVRPRPMSVGTTKLYATIFVEASEMMSRLFS